MTTALTTIQQLLAESALVCHPFVQVALRGSGLTAVQNWSVSAVLKCRKCGALTQALFSLQTWTEFNKQFKRGNLACQCGGVLVDKDSMILTP